MDKKRVNIYVIANEANVSPVTVSRVINRSASVSKEKRDRVWKVIQKYNFIPNALAKGLSSTKSKMLGALLSYGVSIIVNRFVSMSDMMGMSGNLSRIPLWLAFAAIGFAIFVGMAAGFMPAMRAMKLSPLAAIRNE